MSYSVKYRCTHKEKTNATITTYVVELLKKDYSGAVTPVKGSVGNGVFELSYDNLNPADLFEERVQKGRMTFHLQIRGTGIDPVLNYDGQAILNEIFARDEEEFKMRLKINGNVEWTGWVLTDLGDSTDGEFTYSGQIVAKDFTRLSGVYFPLTNDRKKLIETLADFLDHLGLGLDIYSYTSWITSETNDTDDFLNQIYNERRAFRTYASNGDEIDQKITVERALSVFLNNHGLILRQTGNAWRVYQLTTLRNPSSIKEFIYNSEGVKQSGGDTDLTVDVDRVSKFIIPGGKNKRLKALKQVKNRFNHRAKISGISLPAQIDLQDAQTESYSQFFLSSGTQTISLGFDVYAETSEAQSSMNARFRLKIGNYYLQDDGTLSTDVNNYYEVEMQNAKNIPGSNVWTGYFSLPQISVPATSDGTLELTYAGATGNVDFADITEYSNLSFTINNSNVSENSTSINYELTQTGIFSVIKELDDTWFGDGPTAYADSALRFGDQDGQTTADVWQFRGATGNYRRFHENRLKEEMDVQRSLSENYKGQLIGEYSPSKILVKGSHNLFFLGGSLTGAGNPGNVWDAFFIEITVESGADTFEDVIDFDSSISGLVGDSARDGAILQSQRFNESQKITTITSSLSGTVTEIPIESIGEVFLQEGDVFYVFDIRSADLISFVLDAPMLPDSTSLTVQSKSVTGEITNGSWIVFTGGIISTFITRSDQAIRLGVTNVEYLQDSESGEYLTDENGDPIINGESDPGAFLNILKDQLVAKVTAGGLLALAKLSVDVEEESSTIQLKADNIDLEGLVTAINADNGTETQIDGGKIKADTRITVGSGDNVVVLSGEANDYRIWAGNATAIDDGDGSGDAPFRVDRFGNVWANKVNALSGDGSGEVNNLKLKNLEVTGTISVTDGEVNTTDSFVYQTTNYQSKTEIKDGIISTIIVDTDEDPDIDQAKMTLGYEDGLPRLIIERLVGTKYQSKVNPEGVIIQDTDDAQSTIAINALGDSFLTLGTNYESAQTPTAEGNYLKVVIGSSTKYLRLYS